MFRIYIVVFSVIFLLPAACNARAPCTTNITKDVAEAALQNINAARKKLAEGTQINGPGSDLLPKAANMNDLAWDCELEAKFQKVIDEMSCDNEHTDDHDPFFFFENQYYDNTPTWGWEPELTAFNQLAKIDNFSLSYNAGDERVTWDGQSDLTVYANLMRSDATKFACARRICEVHSLFLVYTVYFHLCGTDLDPMGQGDVVYFVLQSTTSATMTTFTTTTTTTTIAPTTTAPTTIPPTTIPPTTVAPTSTAAATAATAELATTAAKGSTGTSCPTYSTTPCPTYPITPCPTYPPARAKREAKTANADVFVRKAKFPKATPGENSICSSNKGMTDSLRTVFLNMHNYRRAKLALGEVIGYDRKRMAPAKNMLKLSYTCELEASALRYASYCPSMRSKASARPNQGENFLRLAKIGFPGFADALNMTVYNWWDVVRDSPGIDKSAKLQTRRFRSPIVTFTQMAWATTRYLGCAIADCNSYYVSICRYSPKGNAIGEMIYKPGNTCTECKRGTTCEEELGLCV